MKTTFSVLTARALALRDPTISTTGFARAMRTLLSELEGASDVVDGMWPYDRPRFIPDAFSIDRRRRRVLAYEIEDTHPISILKLRRMIMFNFWLDTHYWRLRVLIANRYGKITNEIDPMEYFYAENYPAKHFERSDVLTKAQIRALDRLHPLAHEKFVKRCLAENRKKANKTPEPTSRTVAPRAGARVAPVRAVAHL